MATLGTAILAPALVNLDRGDTAAVLTNVAYPLVDLALVAMIGSGLILIRVREARSLLAIGLGMVIWAAADIDYLFLVATNAYEPGWIDVTWQLGALAIAGGALVTPAPARIAAPRRAPLVLPALVHGDRRDGARLGPLRAPARGLGLARGGDAAAGGRAPRRLLPRERPARERAP